MADTAYPVKKLLPLTADLAERVSAWRFEHRVASENEAMRQLLERGLRPDPAPVPSREEITPKPAASKASGPVLSGEEISPDAGAEAPSAPAKPKTGPLGARQVVSRLKPR